MFKFDFDIDDADEEIEQIVPKSTEASTHDQPVHPQLPFQEHPISQFLDALPLKISYSPLTVPVSSTSKTITLLRRDLFDARFQLISTGDDDLQDSKDPEAELGPEKDHDSLLSYLDTPSDLLPGVYEGGLKTWECSLDLVEYLENAKLFATYQGKRVLELGCGTAMPSLYILQQLLFGSQNTNSEPTEIHLQDYNESVLSLMTLPNLILTWYASPASQSYRQSLEKEEEEDSEEPQQDEVTITDELKAAFLSSLKDRHISLRFFSGSWETFDLEHTEGNYDLILTSETIYRTESLGPLTRILEDGCTESLSQKVSKLALADAQGRTGTATGAVVLVAAKVLYFGVGGGISEFVEFISKTKPGRKGRVDTVLDKITGVGRRVLRIHWI
ncbi:hypothetical protein FA15DRAFT_703941 [Coprinopsis marcescibilis]|uniref:protein-histidine N-methyltransferase n=1 Tax=Coprinopsis marcescibilis TaxID=230819 RepID=A0A5C3KZI3_COPMA|nr:hypothetical protein FA15DRAFT_703941 [Coprinopsis marcescibilis]